MNKMRQDYMRDNQNLRNSLCLAVNPMSKAHAGLVKLTANVYMFNDMDGLSSEIVEFFNEKMEIFKEEAQL